MTSQGGALSGSKPERVVYLSALGVVSSLAVVLLHTNNIFWSFERSGTWLSANLIECLCYFAVPIFFMISGATLVEFRSRYGVEEFFHKRIAKTVLPFLAWSTFGLVWAVLRGAVDIHVESPRSIVAGVVSGRFVGVYWFFPQLFIVYLAMPVLAAIDAKIRLKVFEYIIMASLILNVVPSFIDAVGDGTYSSGIGLEMPIGTGYVFYAVLGYYMSRKSFTTRETVIVVLLGAVGFTLHFVGTWVLSYQAGEVVSSFKHYLNLPTVMYSAAIFLLFKRGGDGWFNQDRVRDVITRITPTTFGVYLMHWYLIDVALGLLHIDQSLLTFRLVGGVAIFAICVLLTMGMQRVPILRRVVPA